MFQSFGFCPVLWRSHRASHSATYCTKVLQEVLPSPPLLACLSNCMAVGFYLNRLLAAVSLFLPYECHYGSFAAGASTPRIPRSSRGSPFLHPTPRGRRYSPIRCRAYGYPTEQYSLQIQPQSSSLRAEVDIDRTCHSSGRSILCGLCALGTYSIQCGVSFY